MYTQVYRKVLKQPHQHISAECDMHGNSHEL